MAEKENKLILYKDDEGKLIVNTLFADEDVWLTQAQLVEIYQSSKSNISEHLKNIFEDKELDKEVVVRNSEQPLSIELLRAKLRLMRYCIPRRQWYRIASGSYRESRA